MNKSAIRRSSGVRVAVRPTGKCFCGCGEEVAEGAFFLPGHDRKAESTFIKREFGGVAEMLAAHGYADGLGVRRRKAS